MRYVTASGKRILFLLPGEYDLCPDLGGVQPLKPQILSDELSDVCQDAEKHYLPEGDEI